MRFATVSSHGRVVLAARRGGDLVDLGAAAPGLAQDLAGLLAGGAAALDAAARALDRAPTSAVLDPEQVTWLPPVPRPGKVICVGLNYRDHSAESGFAQPEHPALFARFTSSLVGHGAPILRPRVSEQLDYEGELAAIIGRGGRAIPKAEALAHVAAYAPFNDASVRDYQTRGPQWTLGKNFDGTGAFGPEVVTADELPPGGAGLRIETRLNGAVVQGASTSDLVFDLPDLIARISEAITLEPGDVIVTGTPAGVGLARKPPLWMKAGDTVEVEIEGVGTLRNPVADET